MNRFPAVALALGALVLAGCGSSSSNSTSSSASTPTPSTPASGSSTASSSAAGASKLSLAANPEGQLKYDKTALTAKAGTVSIDFTNSSPVEHNVTIEAAGGKVVGSTPTFQGGAKSVTVNLKPGTYKFFCSVPGHRMAGMEGTLTVQ